MGRGARRRVFKKSARQLLYSDWITQILAFILVGAVYAGLLQFGNVLGALFMYLTGNDNVYRIVLASYITFALILTVPLFYGLVIFEVKAIQGERPRISDIFDVFSDFGNVMFSYTVFLHVFLRAVVFLVPAAALWIFTDFYYYEGIFGFGFSFMGLDCIYFILKLCVLVLFYLVITVVADKMTGVYISVIREDVDVRDCFFVANVCMKHDKGEMLSVILSFAPLFALSMMTAGFLFVMYTLPYMLITLLVFAKYYYDRQQYASDKLKKLLFSEDANADLNSGNGIDFNTVFGTDTDKNNNEE